jgi:hypothetical protein
MAVPKTSTADIVFKLPAETRKRMEEMSPELAKAKAALETLKKIGLDTSVLDEKIKWAEEARNILLTDFG